MSTSKSFGQTEPSKLKQTLPLLSWLPTYQRKWLRFDILTGITVWGSTVSSAMGYAQVAGLPVQSGLYAAMAALIAYTIFGTSSLLKVETSPSMAIMSIAVVAPISAGDYAYFVTLSAALAVVVGLILIAAGFGRMGFLADFLAKPVVGGFLFGLALIVIIGQLPSLFGLESSRGSGLDQLWELISSLSETNLLTLAISVFSFGFLLTFRRYVPGFPGALVLIALSILAVMVFNLETLGVAIVGQVPQGLPTLKIPIVQLSDLSALAFGATAMVFVALGESLGSARTFAAEHHNRIEANQELIALGAANLSAGLMQGMAVGANPASTSSANGTGAKTQIASIVTALILMITLLTRVDLIGYLPQAVIAVAVIVSVSHLIRVDQLKRAYRLNKIDFILAVIALVGVFAAGILPGLVIAVFLSLLIVLYRSSRPPLALLGRVPGYRDYDDISENPNVQQIPGLLILRPDAPLFFINANPLHSQIRKLISSAQGPIKAVIIDINASPDLDIAVSDMLKTLDEELDESGIRLVLVNIKKAVRTRLEHSELIEKIGEENIYFSIQEAVDDLTRDVNLTTNGIKVN